MIKKTTSILEGIRKKMQKIDQTKSDEDKKDFLDLDDEFESIDEED